MAASSTTRRRSSGPVLRSLSPSGKFYGTSNTAPSSSAFASSTSSTFCSRSFIHRSASPTRVNLSAGSSLSASAVRFSIDRPTSPNRSISAQAVHRKPEQRKRTCMCSPTTHPGSFRCSLHKNAGSPRQRPAAGGPYQSNRLYARRSAMTNSLVRIGTVEGDLVKRALAALIRPSSHHQRRRADFQPRPSRLSVMCKAGESI
uniref:Serine-rich protein-like protein n=1 Tax=Opuntia streptacantha TaxID=393608 RepID=A0A7C8ZL43_OPUST